MGVLRTGSRKDSGELALCGAVGVVGVGVHEQATHIEHNNTVSFCFS